MKQFLLASLLSLFLIPHFSFAADHAAAKTHHQRHSHAKSHNTQPVDINKADATQFATLKGIGPKKADAIVAYRTAHGDFKSVNELTHIKGIGAKSLARLQKNNPGRLVINTHAKVG